MWCPRPTALVSGTVQMPRAAILDGTGQDSQAETLCVAQACGTQACCHPFLCLQHCSTYDAQVSEWLWGQVGSGPAPALTVPLKLEATLRYGEPQQHWR